jgi:hypothetical protein
LFAESLRETAPDGDCGLLRFRATQPASSGRQDSAVAPCTPSAGVAYPIYFCKAG